MATVILQLKAMNISDIANFDYISPPTDDALAEGLELLWNLGALDKSMTVTKLGKRLAQFPLDPKLAKVVLSSEEFSCTEEALSIVRDININ